MIYQGFFLSDGVMKDNLRARAILWIAAVSLVAVFFIGCSQAVKIPMDTLRYDAEEIRGPRLLFVFLPGNGDRISVFEKKGLIDAVRAHGIHADMIAVNAHLGYYENGTILNRLREDVIGPARTRGYDQIWMIGNSLGGYGSLAYAREYPDDITGVVLLGPYLGDKAVIRQIQNEGGLFQWDPGVPSSQEWEEYLWLQIKTCANSKTCLSKIYLGYGRNDRFAYAQNYLSSILPQEHVLALPGGHDWHTWKSLWTRFLDMNIFGP
jgi:pimeloyl-ACP methyl ester carboxylesterase